MRISFFLAFIFCRLLTAEPVNKWPLINGELTDILNKKVKWGTGTNGALVLFTSEHCPFDSDWRSRWMNLCQWARKNNFSVYVINPHNHQTFKQNNKKAMTMTAQALGEGVHYISDSEQKLAQIFRIQRTPAAAVFNSDKMRVYYGLIDDQPDKDKPIQNKYLEEALKLTTEGKGPTHTNTQPLGCLISKEPK